MSDNISNFLGTWYVKWATGQRIESGQAPYIDQGYTMFIGTGLHGDYEPKLTGTYDTAVGFALFNDQGDLVLSSGDDLHQAVEFLLLDGTLRWTGYWNGEPVRIYISLGATVSPGGVHTYAIYASTTYGDPDQVGVWGADGNPHGG